MCRSSVTMEICRVCLTTEKDVFPIDEHFVINYNMLTNLNVSNNDYSFVTYKTEYIYSYEI